MTSKLALIADTHIAKQIAIQLRNSDIDIVRLEDIADLPNDTIGDMLLQ